MRDSMAVMLAFSIHCPKDEVIEEIRSKLDLSGIEEMYSHYGSSYMNADELALQNRMAILSVITAAVLGSGSLESSPKADILSMMHTAFIVFAGLSIAGLFFSLARDRGSERS